MRHKASGTLWLALAACLLASAATSAQETAPAAGAPQQPTANDVGAGKLVVQVEYFKGAVPGYKHVPGGGWFARFAKAGPSRLLKGDERVLAVGVKTRMAADGRVEITVGVHLGAKHFDRFEEVGKYYAAAGEAAAADGLTRFGVVPFRFRVLRVRDAAAAAAAPPEVENWTQSVEAVVTEFTPTPLPRGKVTLRNLSPKRVRAVYMKHFSGGWSMGFRGAREGQTLMEPGGTAADTFAAWTGVAGNAAEFTPAPVVKVVVAAVLFEDYSYEGDAEHAALKRAFLEGERAQLQQLMALVREAHAAPDVETPAALQRLRAEVSALGYEAPAWAVDAVEGSDAGLAYGRPGRWNSPIEISMHRVRREMLDALDQFEKKLEESPAGNSFKRWLKQTQARYEGWLANL